MTKVFEFLGENYYIFAIICGVILVALFGFLIIAHVSGKKKKQAENTETTTTDSNTDMSLPEGTEVAAPVDFGTTPEVAPTPVVAEPSLDGLNANVGGDVIAPVAEPSTSEPTLVIEDTAAPVAAPEVAPAPVAAPEVAPAPVATPEVAPAPVAAPEVAPAPVAAPEVAPAPVAPTENATGSIFDTPNNN